MLKSSWVCRIRTSKVEGKTKPLKVGSDIVVIWISGIEHEPCRELGLDRRLHCRRNLGSAKLRALSVKVAIESLKMSAQQHYISLETLLGKRRSGRRWQCAWRRREERDTVSLRVAESDQAIGLPTIQCGGRHGRTHGVNLVGGL